MSRFTIRQVMLASAVMLVLLVVAYISISLIKLSAIHHDTNQLQQAGRAVNAIKDARFHVVQIQQFLTDVGATADEGGFGEAQENLAGVNDSLDRLVAELPALSGGADAIRRQAKSLHEIGVRMARAYIDQGRKAGNAIMKAPGTGLDDASAALADRLAKMGQDVEANHKRQTMALHMETEAAQSVAISFGTAIAVLFILVLFNLYRKTVIPIHKLSTSMRELASGDGDLSASLDERGSDELADVARSFNMFVKMIHDLVKEVASSVGKLGSSSDQMSAAADHTLKGMNQLHGTTDQVATAMNEMVATVQEVASNASQTAEATRHAEDESVKSRSTVDQNMALFDGLAQEVQRAAEVINQLQAESEGIGTILEVIRTIADQTNLLALNAAIEAARAGEQGRGFAVVADEVRTLAQRTQEATGEIESLIGSLQGKAKDAVVVMDSGRNKAMESVERAASVKEALDAISGAITTIADMSAQIASASEQQSAVAEMIDANIIDIAKVAQETTDKAHETANNSGEVGSMLAQLNDQVRRFHFGSDKSLDLSRAKSAHLAWKSRLRAFLDGNATLTLEEAVSHHHCDFGKWYYGDGLATFGHISALQDVEAPHEQLHQLIHQIVEAKNSGREDEAERAYQQIEPLSHSIVTLLDRVERDS